ncbi:hypothetical protein [Candidatus Entotheonella palauensis]|uniref:Uncharacterized protein n=1 Tax=Candidatus Entotheonella gemina TaxID=1429439 RepID=W4MG06_9BACT|nr:hypothetical protein [Candidatus Entotheonella palauensis]ETX09125.1 MAG: hypothetical protein ETSY2_01340 [Candidatus Entotheonella gemina]
MSEQQANVNVNVNVNEIDVAIRFEVLYDTPSGDVCMKVTGYTSDAASQGVRCQIGFRPAGGDSTRDVPLELDEVMQTEAKAAVLDGDALYLWVIDAEGRDLAVSKIDEAKWPHDANPATVQTKSYWLNVPPERFARTSRR